MVHRRSARALTRTPRALRSDNQFVPATGAWLRSACESHLLAAEPERRGANSGLLDESEVKANRVPVSGRIVQSISRVRRNVDGGARWNSKANRSWPAAGQGSL